MNSVVKNYGIFKFVGGSRMSGDVLLEIGCEEIPSGYIDRTSKELQNLATKFFQDERIKFKQIAVFATPRRLVLYIEQVAEKQGDILYEVLGPPEKVAFDKDGLPTQASIGFAKRQGVQVKDLKVKQTERGGYLAAVVKQRGQLVKDILPEALINIIKHISFPKTMRWLEEDLYFARPIRWILALWGEKIVKFNLGPIKSSNKTYGHFIFSPKKLVIKSPKDYKVTLQNNYVIVDQNERKRIIIEQIAKLVAKAGGKVLKDEELIDTVVNLVEYPTTICGTFKKDYLKLPQEILITSMKTHQKYFSVIDEKNNLLPFFIMVKNGPSQFIDIVREGNERVLDARLADAEFFFKQDTKKSLESRVEKLKNVVFQKELGTVYDKTQRVIKLSEYICKEISSEACNFLTIKRIAQLCKTDLITEMVKEFPELEGIMGKVYAHLDGEDKIVAQGIYEHLLPLTSEGALPRYLEGAIVSIADKIDTIVGDFSVGLIPTGSQDPYGLRRQAHGIVRIILDKKLNISLSRMIDESISQIERTGYKINDKEESKQKVLRFFRDRIENILAQENIRYDEIDSVLEAGFDNIVNTQYKAIAIHKLRNLDDFEPITSSFKRANNILRQAEAKGINLKMVTVKREFLQEPEEKNLYEKFYNTKQEVLNLVNKTNYEQALNELVVLRNPIDSFFDKTMIMVEDQNLKNNRLALLQEIINLFFYIADFSKIVVESE